MICVFELFDNGKALRAMAFAKPAPDAAVLTGKADGAGKDFRLEPFHLIEHRAVVRPRII